MFMTVSGDRSGKMEVILSAYGAELSDGCMLWIINSGDGWCTGYKEQHLCSGVIEKSWAIQRYERRFKKLRGKFNGTQGRTN